MSNSPIYKKRASIISIFIIALFLLSCICFFYLSHVKKEQHLSVCIYQNGALVNTIALDSVTKAYSLTINDEHGNYNIIEIRPDSVGIIDANCPDKLCMHMGFQTSSLLPITCLPNHLVVRLEEMGGMILDGVAY